MNISIDDTSPNFVWSTGADDWRAQAPNQVSINSGYFLQSYHATQTKGANVAITFVGAAIQIYGSKGPNHGNYSVTADDNVIKFFGGFSPQLQYQQLLFSRTFGTNFSEAHTVSLKNEENYWLDLDFAVLSISTAVDTSTSDIGFFATTVEPGTSVPPSATNSAGASTSDASSSSSIFRTLTFALAGVLGVLVLAVALWYFFCIRRRRQASTLPGGRERALSSSSSQQEFRYAQKNAQLGGLDTGNTLGSGSGGGSFGGRNKFGKEDYTRSPTSNGGGSIATDPSRYSRMMVDPNAHAASGAARETLIALNNMGKRPGYRSLAGDGAEGSTASIVNLNNDGRETPNSLRTMGSAGQTWLGATRGATDENARFKGRAGRESMGRSGGNKRSSSHGSDSNLSGRGAANRSRPGGLEDINDAKEEEQYSGGMGLSMYAANIRSESELQRMADLKRSASVASSGILDRLQSSPPPAVPELPPSATASNYSRAQQQPLQAPPPRSFSPSQTETSTVHDHGGVYSGLGLATKIQFPYGRNNEMLVHSHSGSLNSTSGLSATTSVTASGTPRNDGSLPLRPPPARHGGQAEERERERAALRDRERAEKEREAATERERQRKREYSRPPPPEYVPTPNASEVSVPFHSNSQLTSAATATTTTQSTGTTSLQRQGTRTGDIPIGIDGGYNGAYDSESQDSHSVAHAYVSTAQHVAVTAGQPTQQPNAYHRQQQQSQQAPLQQPPSHRQHAPMGSNGSAGLGLPNSTTTGTSSKRAVTPDRGRSYNPAGSMAVPGERSGSSAAQAPPAPAWVGRSSEESSKTWGLDGVHGADKMRTGLGRPIMDDRTRLAAATSPSTPQGPRRVSRVPPPRA